MRRLRDALRRVSALFSTGGSCIAGRTSSKKHCHQCDPFNDSLPLWFSPFHFFFCSYAVLPHFRCLHISSSHPDSMESEHFYLLYWIQVQISQEAHFHFAASWIYFFFDVYISSCINQSSCAQLQSQAHSHPLNFHFLLSVWWQNMAERRILRKIKIWKFNSTRASRDGNWLKL